MSKSTKLLFFFGGMFFLALAGLLGVLELLAIVDPAGTKMADDTDPFGNPHVPVYVHFFYIFLILGLAMLGGWFLKKVG